MSHSNSCGGGGVLGRTARWVSGLRCLQLNCRGSEAVWLLLQHSLGTCSSPPDIFLLQDLPTSVRRGGLGFPGFRMFLARSRVSAAPEVGIMIRESIACREIRPFGSRVVGLEVPSPHGVLRLFSAYVQHTTGVGTQELELALRWALSKGGQVIVGMDSNGHSPLWGPPLTTPNPVGETLEHLFLGLGLDVANDPTSPPTFDDGHNESWIDLTLASHSCMEAIVDWHVDTDLYTGSDHRPIWFTIQSPSEHSPCATSLAWREVDWTVFSQIVASAMQSQGSQEDQARDFQPSICTQSVEDQILQVTTALQAAISSTVREKRVNPASKSWWSPKLGELRVTCRRLWRRAQRLRTEEARGEYRVARRAFVTEVRAAKSLAWRRFCEGITPHDVWPSVQRILRPRSRLHVEDLEGPNDTWVSDDAGKARLLATRFFPSMLASESFQKRTSERREAVHQWL